MEVHLRHDMYEEDIGKLRNLIRRNGTSVTIERIEISHPDAENRARLHVKLAYQPNNDENLPKIDACLYAVGFGNSNGDWKFAGLDPAKFRLGQFKRFPRGVNYADLLGRDGLPGITKKNLNDALEALSRYNGDNALPGGPLCTGLVRLIIVVNEAVRFKSVENEVNKVLINSSTSYQPPLDTIRNWGGHFLGGRDSIVVC